MSRKGDCWDNACMESFFGSLKSEWIRDKKYINFEEAKKDIFKYVGVFYNRRRRHASLGYISPAEYEEISEKERKPVA
ncbi:MAG: transposase [Planctomycetes bacterium GWF2_41_51]|nr:MAG: transposase [Planctomycetes bacterium GWF2_41_51]